MVEAHAANSARFGRHDGSSTELDLVRPLLDAVWTPNAPHARDGKPLQTSERVMQMWV